MRTKELIPSYRRSRTFERDAPAPGGDWAYDRHEDVDQEQDDDGEEEWRNLEEEETRRREEENESLDEVRKEHPQKKDQMQGTERNEIRDTDICP